MARYTGAVKFGDGSTMYFVYNGTVDTARPRLYPTEQVATAAWGIAPEDIADFSGSVTDEEIIEVMPYFAHGDQKVHFMSRASKSLGLITGPLDLLSAIQQMDTVDENIWHPA